MEKCKDIKYPIVYTYMPMYVQDGFSVGLNELERSYKIDHYCVTKAYLCEENKRYREDGSIDIEYLVVYPFENDKNNIPQYNLYTNKVSNGHVVLKIFNSYEEAKESINIMNKELFDDEVKLWPIKQIKEELESYTKEASEKNQKYDELEAVMVKRKVLTKRRIN